MLYNKQAWKKFRIYIYAFSAWTHHCISPEWEIINYWIERGIVYALRSVSYDLCTGSGAYRKWQNRVNSRIIALSVSGLMFLHLLSLWEIFPQLLRLVNSPDVNSLISFWLAESPSSGTWGETLNAFIFFLKKRERLPPFKCFAKDKNKAIYKSSGYGPIFGEDRGLHICSNFSQGRAEAKVTISESYSVPAEVNDKYNVLAGTAAACFPHDSYEVFYLA